MRYSFISLFAHVFITVALSTIAGAAISPTVYQTMLGVGMDVDWLKTGKGRKYATKSRNEGTNIPLLFKQRGFDHVRLRVKEYNLTSVFQTTGMTLLAEIEAVVDECLGADLIPVLAFQAHDFKLDPTSDIEKNRVADWWDTVAKQLVSKDFNLTYNLLIETTDEVKKNNDDLNDLYQKVRDKIRETDSARILIIPPNKISDPFELNKLVVPIDDYMMVEWHFYAAGPKRDNEKKQWTNGTESEKGLITDKVLFADSWSMNESIPTWVGAWMPSNYNDGGPGGTPQGYPTGGDYNISEQVVFATFMSQTLQAYDIPHAINSDTKFFDRIDNVWYPEMKPVLDAIIQTYP